VSRTNWPSVIGELGARELSHNDLAALLHVAQSTVSRWAKGIGEPRYDEGKTLLMLHEELCRNALGTSAIS
jgi:predicted transcriptional regulator